MSKNRGKRIFSITIFQPFGPKMFLWPLVSPSEPSNAVLGFERIQNLLKKKRNRGTFFSVDYSLKTCIS